VVALLALLLFGAVVGVVVVAGGDSEQDRGTEFDAPARCLDAWNSDEDARSFTRHNYGFHQYTRAEVGYIRPIAGETISDDPELGDCVVVFARTSLDPEVEYAGMVLAKGTWTQLDSMLETSDLARLQREAFEGANAKTTQPGDLIELE